MFKKLKEKKVAEDPTSGLAESCGKPAKSILSSATGPGRSVRLVGQADGAEGGDTKTATTPGSAVRVLSLDSSVADESTDKNVTASVAEPAQGSEEIGTSLPSNGVELARTGANSSTTTKAMQEQLTYLQRRLTQAEASESAANLERDCGEQQLLQLRQELNDQVKLLREHQRKYDLVNEELSSSQSALVKREATIAEVRQECAGLSVKYSTSEGHSKSVMDEVAVLKNRCKDLEGQAATLTSRYDSLQAEHSKQEAALSQERLDCQAKHRELMSAQEHSRQLQVQLSTQQDLHSEEASSLRERLAAMGQQFADSDHPDAGNLAALAAERDDVEKRLAEVRKQLVDQQAVSDERIGQFEIQAQEKDSDLCQLREKLGKTETSLQSHVDKVKELEDQLRMARDQTESTDVERRQQLAELKAQVEDTESKFRESRQELEKEKRLADQARLDSASKVAELSQQLLLAKEQLAESAMQSSGLVGELENQLARLQTARDLDRSTTDTKMSSLRKDCSELRQSLSESRKQVSKVAEERAMLDVDLTAAISSFQSRNQCLAAFGDSVGRAVSCSLVETSLYSDDDGKLVHQVLEQWLQESKDVFDHAKDAVFGHTSKVQANEDESQRLANALELEQYSTKRLRDELAEARASLEELTAAARNHDDAAVLATSNHLSSPRHSSRISGDAAKPALMVQTSTGDAMAELASVHQTMSALESEVSEKNQTIKQQQHLLADLRKQLQRQLGVSKLPASSSPGKMSRQESRGAPTREKLGSVNDLYLKNVILRYMCSSEAENHHLIRAISTLLGFSAAEEQLVREYCSYKLSWFGAKPAVAPPS